MALVHAPTDAPARRGKVHYPDSDGKPMAETDAHRDLMLSLISALRWRYRDDPAVYVSGNLLLYYEEGNPRRSVAPDVFVVRGVPKGDRRTYLLWEEGVPPCTVIELTSRSTRREDVQLKPEIYTRIGVREYFLFDPVEEYLRPSFQAFHLGADPPQPILPDDAGVIVSAELGLALARNGRRLRLRDLATGEDVADDYQRAEAIRREMEFERHRADEAAAEIARLRALLNGREG